MEGPWCRERRKGRRREKPGQEATQEESRELVPKGALTINRLCVPALPNIQNSVKGMQ